MRLGEVVIARRSGTLDNGCYSFGMVKRVKFERHPQYDDIVVTSVDIKFEDGKMPATVNVGPSYRAVAHLSFMDEEDEQAEDGEDSEGDNTKDDAE